MSFSFPLEIHFFIQTDCIANHKSCEVGLIFNFQTDCIANHKSETTRSISAKNLQSSDRLYRKSQVWNDFDFREKKTAAARFEPRTSCAAIRCVDHQTTATPQFFYSFLSFFSAKTKPSIYHFVLITIISDGKFIISDSKFIILCCFIDNFRQ